MTVVDLPPLPALVEGTVSHARLHPTRHRFRHRQYQWLVDLDALPELARPWRWLGSFDAADHLDRGRLGGGIRGDLDRFLARRDVDLAPADRVVMLANARVFGHVFDPLSVLWCLGPDGATKAAVLEVHNTYGERHAYLLQPDPAGRDTVDKAFYVSPFNDTTGTYQVNLHLSTNRVRVTVNLDRQGERVFSATTVGTPRHLTRRRLVATALRHLAMPQRVSALIRLHGAWLWLKRLPVQPRPTHPEEGIR